MKNPIENETEKRKTITNFLPPIVFFLFPTPKISSLSDKRMSLG
jgi:hypothetical protein